MSTDAPPDVVEAQPAARGRAIPVALWALPCLLAIYFGIATDGLTRIPLVHGDVLRNPAPAYKLATEGMYGSDLFQGFHGAERRTYQFMPMLQLLLAADFTV